MPVGTLTALGIAGVNAGVQALGQHSTNKKNQELAEAQAGWNLDMQREQNQWNKAMWDLSNAYNTPAAQMQRFKEAGLNPHLIYGKGTAGNANPIQSAKAQGYQRANFQSPLTAMGNPMQDAQNIQLMMGQTDNLKSQTAVNNAEAKNKVTDGLAKILDLDIKKGQKKALIDLAGYNTDIAKHNAAIQEQESNYLTQIQEQRADKFTAELNDLNQRIASMKIQDQLNAVKTLIEAENLQLRKAGVTDSDNVILRGLIQSELGTKLINNLKDFDNYFNK